jgi:type I restriction enzyme, S subunit
MATALQRLGDYVRIRTGKLDANEADPNGAYPFFTCSQEPLRIASFGYDCECVLVAGNGDLNVKYYDGKFEAYQRTYIIESSDKQKLDARYLFHFMSEYVERLRGMSIGGVIKYIKLGYLTDAKIPLPSVSEQRRIAEILDRAEALRAKRRATLQQLDTVPTALFEHLFGDCEMISQKWPTKKLGTLLEFLTSGSRGWAAYYADSGDLFLRIQNVRRDELLLDEIAYVNAPNTAEAKRTRVQAGDVLLSITADLGRTAVVPDGLPSAYINQHLSILRTSAVVPKFLSAYLASASGQRQILGRNRQGVKAGLNFDDIRSFSIPTPPLSLQCKFAHTAAALEELKKVLRASLAALDSLLSSLQHRAFRGEL